MIIVSANRAAVQRKFKYGLSPEDYQLILDKQEDRCAICGQKFGEHRHHKPHVDHDHMSGKVRGLLCFNCNSGIGHLKDDPALIQRALNYLKRSGMIANHGDDYSER